MLTRTVVSLVLAPVTLGILFYAPPPLFTLTVLAVALVAFFEYLQLVPLLQDRNRQFWLLGLATAVILGCSIEPESFAPLRICLVLAAAFLTTTTQVLFTASSPGQALPVAAASFFGLVYIPLFLALLVPVRFAAGDSGRTAILFLLLVTWAGDTGAYLIGRLVGRHKLAPSISPAKTIEGAVAGVGFSLCVGLLFSALVSSRWGWVAAIAFNIAGQCGDLFESMLKRGAGVKDSSRLIPGHGGLLDRIDSLLFCCPLLFLWGLAQGATGR